MVSLAPNRVMCQVRHAAASKPVGTGRGNGSRGNETEVWGADDGDALLEVRYEEYFVEHDVSTADARRAANGLNVNDSTYTRYYSALSGCTGKTKRQLYHLTQ